MADTEICTLAQQVVDRIFAVYRGEYIAKCIANEPDSLLAICDRLKRALQADEPRDREIDLERQLAQADRYASDLESVIKAGNGELPACQVVHARDCRGDCAEAIS